MSIIDLLLDFADLFLTRRFTLALAVGIAGAVAAQALLDPPLDVRVAVLSAVAGVVIGAIWEYRHHRLTRS